MGSRDNVLFACCVGASMAIAGVAVADPATRFYGGTIVGQANTWTATQTYSGASPDVTTVGNEDWTCDPAGSGKCIAAGDGTNVAFRVSGGGATFDVKPVAASTTVTASSELIIVAGSSGGNTALSTNTSTSILTTSYAWAYSPQVVTINDDGAGTKPAQTITPTQSRVHCACNDATGCTITMGETGMVSGQTVTIISIGTGNCEFADTAGVTELSAAFVAGGSAGGYDSLSLEYIADRWVERTRSNN